MYFNTCHLACFAILALFYMPFHHSSCICIVSVSPLCYAVSASNPCHAFLPSLAMDVYLLNSPFQSNANMFCPYLTFYPPYIYNVLTPVLSASQTILFLLKHFEYLGVPRCSLPFLVWSQSLLACRHSHVLPSNSAMFTAHLFHFSPF